MQYQAILFDFDYTLGDATASIYEGFVYSFAQMGLPRPGLKEVRDTVGLLLADSYTRLTGDDDPDRRAVFCQWFHQKVEAQQADTTQLFPGALELLRSLHSRGVRLGVVSSKTSNTLRATLRNLSLLELMDFTVGGEQVKAPKPDPEGLCRGIDALGADRGRVLYCGDTVIDAATAQAAGVDFCAVLNGTTPEPAFAPFPSVLIAPDLWALKTWLKV